MRWFLASVAISSALFVAEHGLFSEVVFLTARMGNPREALQLILTEMKDIEEAIRFVQSQKDDELWELRCGPQAAGYDVMIKTPVHTHDCDRF